MATTVNSTIENKERLSDKNTANNNNDDKKQMYRLVNRAKYAHRIRLKNNESVFIAAHGSIPALDPDSLAEDFQMPVTVHIVKYDL